MDKIIEFSTQISTPLILAGIVVSVLWGVFRLVLQKSPEWAKQDSSKIIILVINWIGALSLVATVFGFAGYFILQTEVKFSSTKTQVTKTQVVFRGDLANIDHARELENILLENNGKYVTLDVECEYEKVAKNESRCGALIENYFIFVTGRETFQEYWNKSSDSVASSAIWLKFSIPDGVSARLANSPKGAGHLRAQGTFAILKSTSGVIPPDAIYYELTAVNL